MRRIAAHYVVPVTGDPVRNGVVTLDDSGTILHVGQLERETEDTEFYNGLLCPGFVNAHCHLELSHLQGRIPRGTGLAGFLDSIGDIRERERKQAQQAERAGHAEQTEQTEQAEQVEQAAQAERIRAARLQMERMYQQGTDAAADICNTDETFLLKAGSPLYTRSFIEVFGLLPERAETLFARGMRLLQQARGLGLPSSLAPHAGYSMSDPLLRMTLREGLRSGFLSFHNQESPQEECLSAAGTGPLADRYRRLGFPLPPAGERSSLFRILRLLGGPDTSRPVPGKVNLVHNAAGAESFDAAVQLLQEPYWTVCPRSNLFIHGTLPPLRLMRQKGLTICLGTDSPASNDSLSPAAEILCLHRHFPDIPLTEILTWACLNGAKAIGKERELGSLEPGKRPGIVLVSAVDWTHFRLTPDSRTRRII